MPYKKYCCCIDDIAGYYVSQSGGGGNYPYYQGVPLQRGSGGFGSIFSALFRSAIPLLKSGAKAFGRQVLRSGVDIVKDVAHGKDLKSAAKDRAKEAGLVLTDKASSKIKTMLGGKHKRKRLVKKAIIRKKARTASTPDIFD